MSIKLPTKFKNVKYNALRIPGVKNQSNLNLGANCQLYAYEFLRYFGKHPPELRSSELWTDTKYTEKITEFKFLDLMLYNETEESYGAHVGVYIGNDMILHLSKEIGYPVIQEHKEMMLNRKYSYFIGAKRVIS